jgi:hypothetical protein
MENPGAGRLGQIWRHLLRMLGLSHSSSPYSVSGPRDNEGVPESGGTTGSLQPINGAQWQPYSEEIITSPTPKSLARKSKDVTSTASLLGHQELDGTLSPTHGVPPSPNSAPTQPVPYIFHVTPSSGPICGGIDVGVLGSGFPLYHACTFGGSIATTKRETETYRVCILPCSLHPGPVEVSFQKVPVMGATQIFTYEDTREKDACVSSNGALSSLRP